MAKRRKPRVSLHVAWDDLGALHRPSDREWDQLLGGLHRLMHLTDEFHLVLGTRDLRKALDRLQYAIENYLYRAYELRERAFALLAVGTGEKKLRDSRKRWEALGNLDQSAGSVQVVARLVEELTADIDDRNRHTHNAFLTLEWSIDDQICDMDSVLLQLDEPEQGGKLRSVVRQAIRERTGYYGGRIRTIINLAMPLLDQLDPFAPKCTTDA